VRYLKIKHYQIFGCGYMVFKKKKKKDVAIWHSLRQIGSEYDNCTLFSILLLLANTYHLIIDTIRQVKSEVLLSLKVF
jgi:hypothetical protein